MPHINIPQLGLGTFGRTGQGGLDAILAAIEVGYRHLDTAQTYGTEENVGSAIRLSGTSRAEFFVTTKVADTNLDTGRFLDSVQTSLDTLQLDQVDLLLVHWPSQAGGVPLERYIEALAEAKTRGWARYIGVSNFSIALLERTFELLGEDAIATNQVEIHLYLQSPKLSRFARSHSLTLTAYQPLSKGAVHSDPVLIEIGKAHGASAGAIALAYLMSEGHVVIPSSSSVANLRSNISALQLRLSDEERRLIRNLDRGERRINPAKAPKWDD